jgi:AAA+ ATPase superfamily predicted ATPase
MAVVSARANSSVSPAVTGTTLSTIKPSSPRHKTQLEQFMDTTTRQFPSLQNVRRDWEIFLEALGDEDAIVVIDEFPFLIEEDDSLPSQIQRVWDIELQETGMTLVLVGSSISIMEDKVLSGSAPLYGRRTATIDLKPLDYATDRGSDTPVHPIQSSTTD